MIILTLNRGSSSLKFGLYRVAGAGLATLMTGTSERGVLQASDGGEHALIDTPLGVATPEAEVEAIASLIERAGLPPPQAIGHRVVHGGSEVRAHCLIDASIERGLEAAVPLSPLHAPAALRLLHLARNAWPGRPHVACLDTAFHADMPDLASVLPVAKGLRAEGIRRYGFHGLSCQSIVRQFGSDVPALLIIAHLGSGASVTAVQNGRSIDTSMGLTPSGGVIMGSRSGNIDPGLLIYLMREKGLDAARLETLVNGSSGLLGISGLSGDLRDLHDAAPTNRDAGLAIEMFALSIAKEVAGMMVALEGLDTLVFTGGIGENDASTRKVICERLACLGSQAVPVAETLGRTQLGTLRRSIDVRVIPSRENEEIALSVAALTDSRA